MTAVIIWGVVDIGWVIYKKLMEPPFLLLTINDILATFGAFMAVLIANEIFINISVYLRDDVIHVKIVMATALMAIARKIIILDIDKLGSDYVWAIGGVVLAMSVGYFLVVQFPERDSVIPRRTPSEAIGESPDNNTDRQSISDRTPRNKTQEG